MLRVIVAGATTAVCTYSRVLYLLPKPDITFTTDFVTDENCNKTFMGLCSAMLASMVWGTAGKCTAVVCSSTARRQQLLPSLVGHH